MVLFNETNRISAIEIACETGKQEEVQQKISEILGANFKVKNRYEANDVLFKSLETEFASEIGVIHSKRNDALSLIFASYF